MDEKEIERVLEAILFASGEPVSVERLARAVESDARTVGRVLERMGDRYDFERRGIKLVRLENKAQLCTRPEYADWVRRVMETRKPPTLSQAALETLSIVAYRQPVTRAFVEQLRGVDSSNTFHSLQEKGLIEECGRLDVPGHPFLYRTTSAFLRVFGIQSLKELPDLPELSGAEGEQLTILT